ncbi:MAG TPA: polysaccharide biosynthesis/export family protein, partial [Burkholderiaceae bacterium]|nr:polysaccharide biosynthesis/export family protein [Burkholderiaceae bacterium]
MSRITPPTQLLAPTPRTFLRLTLLNAARQATVAIALAASCAHLPAFAQFAPGGAAPQGMEAVTYSRGTPPTMPAALPGQAGIPQPGMQPGTPALLQGPEAALPDVDGRFPTAQSPATPRPMPSQFQQFVRLSTGQDLQPYGHQFFTTPRNYAPVTNVAAPGNYLIGPGDEVQLQVWGGFDLSSRLTVDRNGQLQIPKVGVVNLTGVRADQLSGVLRAQLAKVFTQVEVSASLSKLRSIQVYVVGQAVKPGTHTLSGLSTLVNALFASGGPGPNGSMRHIELRRGTQVVTRLDLYAFLAQGDKSGDTPLQAGDVIVIPPAGPRVAVAGAFDHPAIYELKGTTTVQQLLAIGGGVPSLATTEKALLERIIPTATPPRQVQQLALAGAGLQTPLQDGDILTLVGISQGFANAVTLKGNVAYPLRHAWRSGMRVLDLIPDAQALITQDYYKNQNSLVQAMLPDGKL